jgi:predicted dehydrogenase
LTPMGVHAIDGMIDLCGPIESVYCQSTRRVVAVDSRRHDVDAVPHAQRRLGISEHDDGDRPGFSFQVFGSKGWVAARGMTARGWRSRRTSVARGSSEPAGFSRRKGAGGGVGGRAPRRHPRRRSRRLRWPPRAARPSSSRRKRWIHGASVTEAVVRSAASGAVERVA